MVIWYMMKPIIYICIKDLESVEINIYWTLYHITELNITFQILSLGIGKSSHHKVVTYKCWSYYDNEPYLSMVFWLFGKYPFGKNFN